MFPRRDEREHVRSSYRASTKPVEHLARAAIAHSRISAILFGVRNFLGVAALTLCIFVLAPLVAAQAPVQQGNPPQAPQATPPAAQQQAPVPPTQAPAPEGPVIVLNPAHGGTDSGARGQSGVMEKDLVLQMARGVKAELERQGFRVIMTRNDDSNPSYDDRAAMANGYRDSIFVSLHIASTGTSGSVRAYYDQMAIPYVPAVESGSSAEKAAPPVASGLSSWNEAQRGYTNASHRLAELIQIELAQKFSGTPDTSPGAAVRGLRSVAAPAVAVELSSVSATDPNALANSAAAPLGDAIGRAITAFRAVPPGGARQ
ncbi:MAG TPA: N-acetylmuramoyl-L-alanine amidase [Candidatus Acidoferrales bacterium]|jgi:N-acetylmuramoyl-L-alanine amidase|nr:N-acetylmuramoyl-L-alanine amidase [Candidatus Acidoferrales bacterium]